MLRQSGRETLGANHGILHTVLKVVYTLYVVPTGLGALAGFLSIDIMSLTGQSVNRQMEDAQID